MAKDYINRRMAALFIGAVAILLAAIVYLKNNSRVDEVEMEPVADTLGNMAVPDTTIAADVDAVVKDTVTPTPVDTVRETADRDPRRAEEAGAEDGYWSGLYDGESGCEMAENDVSSNFPTQREREAYAANYAEGYRRGYEEGCRNQKTATEHKSED